MHTYEYVWISLQIESELKNINKNNKNLFSPSF